MNTKKISFSAWANFKGGKVTVVVWQNLDIMQHFGIVLIVYYLSTD